MEHGHGVNFDLANPCTGKKIKNIYRDELSKTLCQTNAIRSAKLGNTPMRSLRDRK
jgi:hypothetical protein